MNIKDYISSGILELYVLGQTSEEETKEVEMYAKKYSEIKSELDAAEAALLTFGETVAQAPKNNLEHKILERVNESEKEPPDLKDNGEVGSPSKFVSYLLPGLIIILALAGLFYFYQQNKKNEAELESIRAEYVQLQKDCDAIQKNIENKNQYIAVVGNANYQTVIMGGQAPAPSALAMVHWNPVEEVAHLEIQNLPDPPFGKQYQLWAIVDGQPTDMGVFDIEKGELVLQKIPFIKQPQAFAVTLEDEGGKPIPTLNQMYLLGEV